MSEPDDEAAAHRRTTGVWERLRRDRALRALLEERLDEDDEPPADGVRRRR